MSHRNIRWSHMGCIGYYGALFFAHRRRTTYFPKLRRLYPMVSWIFQWVYFSSIRAYVLPPWSCDENSDATFLAPSDHLVLNNLVLIHLVIAPTPAYWYHRIFRCYTPFFAPNYDQVYLPNTFNFHPIGWSSAALTSFVVALFFYPMFPPMAVG